MPPPLQIGVSVSIAASGHDGRAAWPQGEPGEEALASGIVISSVWDATAIGLKRGASDVLIENCSFEKIGQWRNTKPFGGTTSVSGVAIKIEDAKRITVQNCTFTKMKTGVAVKFYGTSSTSDITIKDSTFNGWLNWAIDVNPAAAGAAINNLTIDGNTFRDLYHYDEKRSEPTNTTYWTGYVSSSLDNPHQDTIFLRTSGLGSTVWNNVVIRNNLFLADATSDGGTASIYISQGPSALIYNNVFLKDNKNNGQVALGHAKASNTTQTVRIFNNTVISGFPTVVKAYLANPDVLDVRNNLIWRVGIPSNPTSFDVFRMIYPGNVGTSFTCDYNLFAVHGGEAAMVMSHNGTSGGANYYISIAGWKALGHDAHSVLADGSTDPLVTSVAGVPSIWDCTLPANSLARGAGANLSAYFTTDKDGNTRSAWDIGAYEYQP